MDCRCIGLRGLKRLRSLAFCPLVCTVRDVCHGDTDPAIACRTSKGEEDERFTVMGKKDIHRAGVVSLAHAYTEGHSGVWSAGIGVGMGAYTDRHTSKATPFNRILTKLDGHNQQARTDAVPVPIIHSHAQRASIRDVASHQRRCASTVARPQSLNFTGQVEHARQRYSPARGRPTAQQH